MLLQRVGFIEREVQFRLHLFRVGQRLRHAGIPWFEQSASERTRQQIVARLLERRRLIARERFFCHKIDAGQLLFIKTGPQFVRVRRPIAEPLTRRGQRPLGITPGAQVDAGQTMVEYQVILQMKQIRLPIQSLSQERCAVASQVYDERRPLRRSQQSRTVSRKLVHELTARRVSCIDQLHGPRFERNRPHLYVGRRNAKTGGYTLHESVPLFRCRGEFHDHGENSSSLRHSPGGGPVPNKIEGGVAIDNGEPRSRRQNVESIRVLHLPLDNCEVTINRKQTTLPALG